MYRVAGLLSNFYDAERESDQSVFYDILSLPPPWGGERFFRNPTQKPEGLLRNPGKFSETGLIPETPGGKVSRTRGDVLRN